MYGGDDYNDSVSKHLKVISNIFYLDLKSKYKKLCTT